MRYLVKPCKGETKIGSKIYDAPLGLATSWGLFPQPVGLGYDVTAFQA
jgi:hypothetical protein